MRRESGNTAHALVEIQFTLFFWIIISLCHHHSQLRSFSFLVTVSWWDRWNFWGKDIIFISCLEWYNLSAGIMLLEGARHFHFQDPVLVVKNGHILKPQTGFYELMTLEAVNSAWESKDGESMPSCVMHVTVMKNRFQQTNHHSVNKYDRKIKRTVCQRGTSF